MPGRGLIPIGVAAACMVFGGQGIYNVNNDQKNMISEALQSIMQMIYPPTVLPEPKDISEIKKNEFNFGKDSLITALNMTKFSKVDKKKTCKLYEDQPVNNLHKIIDLIGSNNNLAPEQTELMKLSLSGGRTVDAVEIYSHGREGRYLLMKFTAGRKEGGNYDFMIATYGYSWTLDVLTKEETMQSLETQEKLDGVPKDMIPEAAKTDVLDFIEMQTKLSISVLETEEQTDYFRGLSEKALAYLCPKIDKMD
jgi:hypothetical protein